MSCQHLSQSIESDVISATAIETRHHLKNESQRFSSDPKSKGRSSQLANATEALCIEYAIFIVPKGPCPLKLDTALTADVPARYRLRYINSTKLEMNELSSN
jgi:hypothetical protein